MIIPKINTGSQLVIATHNIGKIREIKQLLNPYHLEIYSAHEISLPEPKETGSTFRDNAQIKAIQASKISGMISMADDSGFCLNGLNGDPGLYSARWAGPDKNYDRAMQILYEKLQSTTDKTAYFICVLCIAWPNGITHEFEGRINGHFVWPPRGHNGHGYDPVFQPSNSSLTFAEMSDTDKNRISHRALAFQKFVKSCF